MKNENAWRKSFRRGAVSYMLAAAYGWTKGQDTWRRQGAKEELVATAGGR